MDESLFVLLLLSGLFWISSALSRQYRYISLNKSWLEAQSYCRGKFTDLATVDTVDDVNELVSTMNAGYNGPVWIGLKRGTETHWAWANGEDSKYSYWGPGEPGSVHDCVLFDDYWVTKKCSDLHYVLCGAKTYKPVIKLNKMNWTDGQKICRKSNMNIATIHNDVEKNDVDQIMRTQGKPAWIGLSRDSWEWSDKWSGFFRNWEAGKPSQSAGSGDCVSMSKASSGKWADNNCDLRLPFFCYGDEKIVTKKQTVRLKLSCNGTCSLNDPSLQTAVLKHIKQKLKSVGLEKEIKISWIKSEDEKVIHQESNHTANSDNQCSKP